MPSAVHVANQLSELSQEQLTELLVARPFLVGRQRDLHDLADTLLSPDSISATVRGLSRQSLTGLLAGHADESAQILLLSDDTGVPYPEVIRVIPDFADEPAPPEPAPAVIDASTLLHTAGAIRDVIVRITTEPLPMSATGGVLKTEQKSLSQELVIPESKVHSVVWMTEIAGFARTIERRLRVTVLGMKAVDDLAQLWRAAAHAVLAEFPTSVLSAVRSHGRLDRSFCEWAWPLRDTNSARRLDAIMSACDALGLVAGSTTESGRAVLHEDSVALDEICGRAFPELLNSVYVLDDLSIIAPGPISSTTALSLDLVSTIETRGLAAKRRLDPSKILRAIASGKTVDELVAILTLCSLTPLTSAVTSTIRDIATNTRFVILNGTGTDTAARASHPELGSMLLTDPRLQRLAPVGVDDVTVLYGASLDRVETALIEGRYTVVSPERTIPMADATPPTPLTEIAENLWEVGLGSSHLERALVVAGKARAQVTLVIETGTGLKTITLEPRNVANGRVRGLDTGSDVERTLPISAIRELKAVGE